MNQRDRDEFRADGLSAARRANFAAGEAAVRAWRRQHPTSLDDYCDFLEQIAELFPSPTRRPQSFCGWRYLL